MTSFAILNTEQNLKLDRPHDSEFWNEELTGYIVRMDGKSKLRIITSWGRIASLDTIGLRSEFHSDQSGRHLGQGTVIGILRGDLAELGDTWPEGSDICGLEIAKSGPFFEQDIPNSISHWVFK